MSYNVPSRLLGANSPVPRVILTVAVSVFFTLTTGSLTDARDILRGGSGSTPANAASNTSNAANAAAAQSAAIAQRANDTLTRTALALQNMQAMQSAARAAAIAGPNNLGKNPNNTSQQLPDVSDGLSTSGLLPDSGLVSNGVANPVPTWVGANTPVQTTAGGQTNVTIVQTQQTALLNWQKFDIGKNTTLTFDQKTNGGDNVSQWIAFNKINDPSGVPSQILGSIKAAGQVYLINQNGIIFGGSSQVDTHALVASSLPINDNLVSNGLINNPDMQFLFSSLPIAKLSSGSMLAFTPTITAPGGVCGDVTVQAGATLTSPTTSDHVGGKIALIGPNVTNEGTISTPDGQAILAAGQQVAFVGHANSDASMRGLDIYVGQGGGVAQNAAYGLIDSPRGNISMVGKSIDQLGGATSTTSVSLNGRIDLISNYNAVATIAANVVSLTPSASGAITLGAGSLTQIQPETSSASTVVGTTLALGSQINLQGKTIYMGPDAVIKAPSATVAINAGTWLPQGSSSFAFANTSGQVYLDSGATIDVTGSEDVKATMSQNIVSVQLRGSELADSPTQRKSLLRGLTINVDIRRGTPLANATGYINNIHYSVGELTLSGGSVNITAGDSVVTNPGSKIDVSGGWLTYTGGTVQTTRLISGGHIYDISQATADLTYDGIYSGFSETHARWNVTNTYTSQILTGSHYEPGYIQGGNGGSIHITAPSMAIGGHMYGNTVTGSRQRQSGVNANALANPYTVPNSSALALVFKTQHAADLTFYSPTPPSVFFGPTENVVAADAFNLTAGGDPLPLRADLKATLVLSPDLVNVNGFGNLTINNSDGNITVPSDVRLTGRAGGSMTLTAANLDIEGKVAIPSGSLNFTVYDYSPYKFFALSLVQGAGTPPADSTRGLFTLGATASLSTAGLTVDDRAGSATAETMPLATKGGSISIASYSANLATRSSIDASGGLAIGPSGKKTYGRGGGISISAGQDLDIAAILGGQLTLGAKITAYGGLQDQQTVPGTNLKVNWAAPGGSLSILAPLIQIGGAATNANTLLLSPDFFNQGGFSSFTLSGLGAATSKVDEYVPAVEIAANTTIAPIVQTQIAIPDFASPSHFRLMPLTPPQGMRAPVKLTFNAGGVSDMSSNIVVRGDIVMENGAVIRTEPNASASVTLKGQTVAVLGKITVPGGSISISGGSDSKRIYQLMQSAAVATVDLGPASVLSTAGAEVIIPDPRGYRSGSVLGGGNITVSGNIVAESGAILDVSGANGVLDFLPSYVGASTNMNGYFKGSPLTPIRWDSNGGTITLAGAQELFSDATLLGSAGGSTALGGNLMVSSGFFVPPGNATPTTPADITMVVSQNGKTIPAAFYATGQTAIGKEVVDTKGAVIAGGGHFSLDSFAEGNFDTLTLPGTVQFSGPIALSANRSLTIANSGVIYADSNVVLSAPYVAMGSAYTAPLPQSQQTNAFVDSLNQPYYLAPTYGTGNFTVRGSLIDIGNLSLQNIGTLNLYADNGDIRGYGTLDLSGNINIRAGQVYTPTATNFTIAAYDHGGTQGTVTLRASGNRQIPLSAGGRINIYGSLIDQGGVVRAPIGTINLGWDGKGTTPQDWLTGYGIPTVTAQASLPTTAQLTLSSGGVTSVSAVDPLTGEQKAIPYGVNLNGISWIDPTGTDITASGMPTKLVNLSAASITDQKGSVIDLSGGGDLYAYRWTSGVGGSKDVLATTSGFAILPGYEGNYAPYASYNNTGATADLFAGDPKYNSGIDPGYVNGTLKVGDQVYLNASNGLAAGVYTLLPARYALLKGAFLVTPQTGIPVGTVTLPGGASLVSGYRLNNLDAPRKVPTVISEFQVASSSVVRSLSQYDDSYANSYMSSYAKAHNTVTPRLPQDSGQLILAATGAMSIHGAVSSQSVSGGRGGMIDISSPVDILIAGSGASGSPGVLVLDAQEISAFDAESVLIGGVRTVGANGTTISVNTGAITVDNAGSALHGSDVILVANNNLTLKPGADIESSGALPSGADSLLFGNSNVAGSGNGLLLRVSADPSAQVTRSGVDSTVSHPTMTIGAGAVIKGTEIVLDSTYGTALDPDAVLTGNAVVLNSGQINIQLANAGVVPSSYGMSLTSVALQTLQSTAQSITLSSYPSSSSSIDIYGNGQIGLLDVSGHPALKNLTLHTGEIRGFNTGGNTVTFTAQNIALDNKYASTGPGSSVTLAGVNGTLEFKGSVLTLGANTVNINQYANVAMNLSDSIVAQGVGGLSTQGALSLTTPGIIGNTGADQTITAGGALTIQANAASSSPATSNGLGAKLKLIGTSVTTNANISLPSGILTLHATNGDVVVGNKAGCELYVGGVLQTFQDTVKYTSGGQLNLMADTGNIQVYAGSSLSVEAPSSAGVGGNAGSLSLSAPTGTVNVAGALRGQGGAGGTFSLDVGSLASFATLNSTLNASPSSFLLSRSIRVRTGDVLVDDAVTARTFNLTTDGGAITISNTIDASGAQGGAINLNASGNLTLTHSARLTASATNFDSAGKGGSVSLATTQGRITIAGGAIIELKVDANTDAATTAANALLGNFNGTLHLRAPQIVGTDYVAIDPLAGSIFNASSIVVEGFYAQDAKTTGVGVIDSFKAAALANATSFMANASAIQNRLLATNANLENVFHVRPGEEIDNSAGDLVLNADWDLSTWRFGSKLGEVDATGKAVLVGGKQVVIGIEPGILTLRAKGNITFNGMLSDGFGDGAGTIPKTSASAAAPWKETLLPLLQNVDKTLRSQQSWSYHITTGADLSSADSSQVLALNTIGTNSGSFLLGKNNGTNTAVPPGTNALTDAAVTGFYQVIRTGAGDINITAGRDVNLLNAFATIYTAGALVADPTMGGSFDLPILNIATGQQGTLGAIQETPAYPAQYSMGGGNVTIVAQGNIQHETLIHGVLIPDSERQLPINWLYRRGYVNPATGTFGSSPIRKGVGGDVESTTWWVDFSNFFEGIGALGGGNVTLLAGNNIANVDAVVPTNARMKGKNPDKTAAVPAAANLLELGGGNLVVRAGGNIDGGVYYVERGKGILSAGANITTNSTRTPSLGTISGLAADIYPSQTWLPTTLFLGKGSFDVSARGDLLLGPVANAFLLPEGYSNTYWYKTYFSTYAATDAVNVTSLGGSVTLRESATLPSNTQGTTTPMLEAWLANVMQLSSITVSNYQPWLRLNETDVTASSLATIVSLLPPTLNATALSGNINLVGNFNLWPSPQGTVNFTAAGSINGVQISGITSPNFTQTYAWNSSSINLSDANPGALPSITSPYAFQIQAGSNAGTARTTAGTFFQPISNFFNESGSMQGQYASLQSQEALHAAGLLHAADASPVRLYAENGDISGLTLFSGKAARLVAGQDITDVALYIQNVSADNVSIVSAGRDIIAYDTNSPLRVAAQTPASGSAFGNAFIGASAMAGDIQIAGPGTLEVLAGRNLDLGVGQNYADGTGLGLVSIGSGRNPYLPFSGANIIAGAGISTISSGLSNGALDFQSFIATFLNPSTGGSLSTRYLPELGALLDMSDSSNAAIWTKFNSLSSDEQRDIYALDIFYLVLRDAGRDHNDAASAGYKNYSNGMKAVATLLPLRTAWTGDISLTSREVKTKNGGNINLFAPGGKLTVGFDINGTQPIDQGILTEHGGNISIFTHGSVIVGTSRIFTLRGGNEIIWSTVGDIAAGTSSKTLQSAPPTRVLVDPTSGDVKTDLSGLATGGGIGVLQTLTTVAPGDVDLIAPSGAINAGDAGIRSSGNLNISAVQVLNASNISVGGASSGTPVVAAAPSLGSLQVAAQNTTPRSSNSADEQAAAQRRAGQAQQEQTPSLITVEVIGYGGGEGEN